jgi:ribosomal protein S14
MPIFECTQPKIENNSQKSKRLRKCVHCGERHPIERTYRLCKFCFLRTKKRINLYEEYILADRPVPRKATTASPGREEKIRVMIQRLRRGEALHHPDDKRDQEGESSPLPAMLERAEPVLRAANQTGVERFGQYYRVRPFYNGKKRDQGIITKDEKEAVAVAEAFWRRTFGLFADHADQMKEIDKTDRQIKRRRQRLKKKERLQKKKMLAQMPERTIFSALDAEERAVETITQGTLFYEPL